MPAQVAKLRREFEKNLHLASTAVGGGAHAGWAGDGTERARQVPAGDRRGSWLAMQDTHDQIERAIVKGENLLKEWVHPDPYIGERGRQGGRAWRSPCISSSRPPAPCWGCGTPSHALGVLGLYFREDRRSEPPSHPLSHGAVPYRPGGSLYARNPPIPESVRFGSGQSVHACVRVPACGRTWAQPVCPPDAQRPDLGGPRLPRISAPSTLGPSQVKLHLDFGREGGH